MSIPRPIEVSMSSIPRLLSSNDEPSEDETQSVSAVIASIQSELSALESTIAARRSPFRVLAKPKLSEFASLLAAHKAVLSPARRIPTEILQKIFADFGEIERSTQNWGAYHARHLPWVVSHICRSWRQVALGIPAIWARIPRITLRSRTKSARNVDLLQTLLTRSATAPLTLDIVICKSKPPLKTTQDDTFLSLILSHSYRIQTLLIVTGELFDILLLSPMRSNISSLRTLVLSIEDTGALGSTPPIDTFEDAPSLRTVKMIGRLPTGASLVLPLNQLTSYYERPYSRDNNGAPSPISEYLNLEILQISEAMIVTSESYSGRLENLRHLAFDKADWMRGTFFSDIELPVVENIALLGAYDHAYRELASMIERSLDHVVLRPTQGHTLQRLSIYSEFNTCDGELTTLLRLTPNLRYLRTPHIPFPGDLKALMQVGAGLKPDLVPKLMRLVMGSSPADDAISGLQWDLLPYLVRSRCEESMLPNGDFFRMSLAFNTPQHLHDALFRLNGWPRYLDPEVWASQGSIENIDLIPPLEERVWKCLNLQNDGPSAARKILSSWRLEKQVQKCLLSGASLKQLIVSVIHLPYCPSF